jgi:hypothetical protein
VNKKSGWQGFIIRKILLWNSYVFWTFYHTATAALVWTPNHELANSPPQYLGLPESFILKDLFPGLKFLE